jgi:topoisomerase-4 subunit B
MNENYGINEIQSLSFKEGVRTRIQMYLGSDDLEGTYQAFKEIINNSTDEAIAGYGDKIEISVDEELNAIRVRDYGRGVPFGMRKDGENVLVSIYSKSHTGGKFEEGAYKNASGLNGIGAKCVCLSAQWFDVFSIRDGKEAHASFKKGELITYEEFKSNLPNGTIVEFSPDPEVFKTGEIGYS